MMPITASHTFLWHDYETFGANTRRDRPAFEDARLPELLFHYRARNFPHSLTDQEARRWEAQRT